MIGEDSLRKIVAAYAVGADVLADEVSFTESEGYIKEYDLGGIAVTLSVCRI